MRMNQTQTDSEAMLVVDQTKEEHLVRLLSGLETVVVAFSGGADSTLLLAMSIRVLGSDRVLAVTADSPTLPRTELADTKMLAAELGCEHLVISTAEMQDDRFASNPRDRCYYCKSELFAKLREVATERGFEHLLYGATASDLGDHRPGMIAAQEARAVAPLLEAGFAKEDVRSLSRRLGLRTWDKPAMACLSSRFPYGDAITESKLSQVERAEEFLRNELGFRQVRVRHHDAAARIEIEPDDMAALLVEETRLCVVNELRRIGYQYVTLDLQGFRSGSMDELPESSPARPMA